MKTRINQTELCYYEIACSQLAEYFIKKYFGKDVEYYWCGDILGGTISIADYYFSMSDIADFIRYKYSKKMMFEYYDKKLDCGMKGKEWKYNIYSYKKLK